MRTYALAASVCLLTLVVFTGTLIAHHSFSAEFDGNQKVELTGIVTKVEWTNPHVWFYFNVTDPDTGDVVNWGAEMGPPHLLQRRGWRRESLQIGQEVSLTGSLARNGSKRVNASNVTLTATGGAPGETLDAASSESN
jgi:hypothetical protein